MFTEFGWKTTLATLGRSKVKCELALERVRLTRKLRALEIREARCMTREQEAQGQVSYEGGVQFVELVRENLDTIINGADGYEVWCDGHHQ